MTAAPRPLIATVVVALTLATGGCAGRDDRADVEPATTTTPVSSPAPTTTAATPTTATPTTATTTGPGVTTSVDTTVGEASAASPRPDWLGTRVLTPGPDGTIPPQPTPPELDPRVLETVDLLPPPADGRWASTIQPVPTDVLARSTWTAECPVAPTDLAYVTVSFWGFDDRAHTGELLVNVEVAEDVTAAFQAIFEDRFPIEEMRVTAGSELTAPPTGDGNNTGAFVCRAARGSGTWSQHAYGLAIDINPFQNPYSKGNSVVLPELATSYLDREDERPGMITADGPVISAFESIGWTWGGTWDSPVDRMHFSRNGS